jgi:hypothetical protein
LSSVATAVLVFACVFGAALMGMFLRVVLPAHHLNSDTKDSVKLAMGLVATLAALILGLLVASAKNVYDTERNGVTQIAAKIVVLDRVLAMYGPEANETRDQLRRSADRMVAHMWPDKYSKRAQLDPSAAKAENIFAEVQQLSPQDDLQRALKSQAWTTAMEISQLRWLEFEQADTSISWVLLSVLTLWLAILFLSFGLFSPSNGTVIATLTLAAISVSAAIFLLLELDRPFDGIMQIPDAPFVDAISHLGK